MTIQNFKNQLAGKLLGRSKSEKKARASRKNGKLGGYWKQKRNQNKKPTGLNALFEDNNK